MEPGVGVEAGFCVAIPMYNEEGNAESCVRALSPVLEGTRFRTQLLVVDDGSRDDTASILRRLQEQFRLLRVVTHRENEGYGASVRTAVAEALAAGFGYVLFMDSDLTNDPKYIEPFVHKMEQGCQVIKASRYVAGGGMDAVPPHRMLISRTGNYVARHLMGVPITDCTNGFRAVRTDLLRRMPLTELGFPVIMEELYHAKRLATHFCEIPYVLTSRGRDKGFSKFSYSPMTFWAYFKYVLRGAFVRLLPNLDR